MPDFNELLKSIQSQAKTYDSNYINDNQSQSISLVTPKQEQLSFSDYTPFKKETVYSDLSSGERVARFDNYIPGTNNEERLAQGQSTGDKWANGALKFGAKTFNAVVGGTLGVVNGVAEGLSGGSIYDNDFSNWLADVDTKLNYQLPNYYTEQEKNAGTFSQMGTANFWADKFLGGLSFTAGAIVSEGLWAWATGGTSLATTGARLGARGASLFGKASKVGAWGLKNLDEATTIAGMSKYRSLLESVPGKMYQAGTIGKKTALALGKTGELVSTAGFAVRSAGYEASVEALQYKREAEENFYSSFAELNGREPSTEETTEFQKNLNDSANAVFTANMAIVGASNIVTMGHILDIKNPINLGIGKFIDRKAFGYGLDKATGEVLKASAKQKIARNVFDYVVKPGLTEGLFEEGLQGVTTKTANKWIEHTYNPKHTVDNFNTIDAMKESLSEQYGSEEGWKENMLGILVGIVGGSTNTYQGQKNKAKDLEFEASVGQMYKPEGQTLQSSLLGFKMQSANRTQAFAQEAKEEAQKGNITKSTLAHESSVLNMINARQVLGDSNSQIVSRTKESLDLIKPEQWLEMGVEADQIEQEKTDRINRVSELADQWKTNKKYVQYMLGNKLVGEDALGETALETSTNTQFNKNAALVEAMTWTLTTGENSQKHMLDAQKVFNRELGQEKTKVLDIISQKEQLKKETQVELNKLTKQHSLLSKKREVLTRKIAKLDAQPKVTDQNKKGLQPRVALTEQLLGLETQLTDVTNGLEIIAEDLNSANDYNKGLNDVNLSQEISKPLITGQDLIDLEVNTEKFRNSIEAFSSTNPQKYQYLIDVLDEYGQAKAIFMQSQASHKAFISKDFKLQNVGSWIGGKMSKNKKMSENTSEWLNDVLKTYTEYKAEGLREEQEVVVTPTVEDDKKEAIIKQEVVEQEVPKTKVEIYKDKIKKALEMYDFTPIAGSYEDVVLKEPTQAEVDEYVELKKNEKDNSLFSARLQELTDKLSNWKLLNSTVDDENASIVETLALIEQLEREVEQEQTRVELTQEDVQNLSSPIEGVNNINDYGLGINVNASVTVQRPAGLDVYRFSHMSVEEMAKRVGADTIIIDNEVVSANTKPKVDKNVVINGIEFVYRPQGKLELKITDYDQASLMFNFVVVDTGAVTWSYSDVYTKKGEDVVKLDSMFFDDIDSAKAFNLKPGDKLKLVVNNTDGYNTEKSTEKEFKIFLQDKNGNRVQTLKASRELGSKDTVNEPFLQLRNEAFKRWVAEGRPDKTDLGIEVEVENIFMGSPEMKLDEDFDFTDRAITEVLATGYIQDGEATLNREIPEINYTYVGKLKNGLKNPIVIIKKGVYNVAFPISMIRKADSKINELNGVLNGNLSPQEKTLKINDLIVENSIEHPQIGFSELESESLRAAFENNESYTTAEELADKTYKKDSLVEDATIRINLENLDKAISDVKVRFNLETISYKVAIETKNDNLIEVENSLNDLAMELYKDYTANASTTYLDSKGNIIEDTVYTDALDEEIIEAKSQLDKIRNINLLIQAFSEKLPKVVEQVLGAEKIKEIKGLIKQYTFIKKQTVPKQEIKKDICT
jgi:hypothetical protein